MSHLIVFKTIVCKGSGCSWWDVTGSSGEWNLIDPRLTERPLGIHLSQTFCPWGHRLKHLTTNTLFAHQIQSLFDYKDEKNVRPKHLVLQWKTQPPPPLDSLLKSKWDKKIHMFQRVLWQILTPTFFSCWWKSILARVTLLLQPLSLKGTRLCLMLLPPFVKWLEFFS